MTRALILGGTRFVGKRLVPLLIEKGIDVTVATRGRVPVPFDESVHRITLDRSNRESLQKGLGSSSWDLVYDQICFTPNDAEDSCAVLKNRVDRYIMCSSQAVYAGGTNLKESAFDPVTHPIQTANRREFSYAEGKRSAEAVFLRRVVFPVATVRFPIILGIDDYSRRLAVQIERVRQSEPLAIQKPTVEICLISSTMAAQFLAWFADSGADGPFNARSQGAVRLSTIVHWIEDAVGKPAIVESKPEPDPFGLFTRSSSFTLNTEKARTAGVQFDSTELWMKELISELAVSR